MRELLLAEPTSNKLEVSIDRPIAKQFRQWLLDEAGKAEASINACEFI